MDKSARKVIAVVVLAPFMTQMDSTVVNVSLSSIARDLHAPIALAQWIVSGYLLALALVLPINGWLVDRIGAKRLYLVCFSVFTLTSFCCGSARSMNGLIAARLAQGVAGGLLAPLTQLMMARVAGNQLVRVIGVAAAPILLAPLLGPILAGIVLKHAGWPWLFYINLPVGALALVLASRFIPNDDALLNKRPFDARGFLMISPGLAMLIYGFEEASHRSAAGACAFGLGAILVAMFIRYAWRQGPSALIDLRLFKIRPFSAAAITQFLSNGILYGGQFLIPLYLTSGADLSAVQAGWILSAMGGGMLIAYPSVGRVTDAFGIRTVASGGVLLNLLGTFPFLWMARYGFSLPLALVGLFIRGVGQGSTGIPSIAAAYSAIPKESLSYATTAINIVQRLGGPIVTTILAVVVSLSSTTRLPNHSHAFEIPFIALLCFQLLVLGATRRLPATVTE